MRFVLWGAVLSSALIGTALTATSPGAAGLDGLHEKIQVGNRLCMAGHTHHWAGNGASRSEALASAAQGWGSFTALEYGHAWSDVRASYNQNVKCDVSGGHWQCEITAAPCRTAGRAMTTAAPHAHHAVPARPVARTSLVRRPTCGVAGHPAHPHSETVGGYGWPGERR